MTRTTRTAPKASPLYARIRNAPDPYTRLLVVPKSHALRDEFSEVHMAAGPMNRKSNTSLLMEGQSTGYALRSELGGTKALKILYALRIESLRPDSGTSGTTDGGAGYGR